MRGVQPLSGGVQSILILMTPARWHAGQRAARARCNERETRRARARDFLMSRSDPCACSAMVPVPGADNAGRMRRSQRVLNWQDAEGKEAAGRPHSTLDLRGGVQVKNPRYPRAAGCVWTDLEASILIHFLGVGGMLARVPPLHPFVLLRLSSQSNASCNVSPGASTTTAPPLPSSIQPLLTLPPPPPPTNHPTNQAHCDQILITTTNSEKIKQR